MADPYLLEDEDPALMLPPLARQRALAGQVRPPGDMRSALTGLPSGSASLTSIPTQGPMAVPTPRPERQQATDAQKQLMDMTAKPPDMSGEVERYRKGYEAAGPDMALAFFIGSQGGKMGQEFGGQVLKNALAARQPKTTDYGTLDYEGFTPDANKERAFQVARQEKQIQFLENQAVHAETAEERAYAHRQAEQLRRDQMRMHQENLQEQRVFHAQTAAQGRFMPIKDADGNVSSVLNTRTGEIVGREGAAGGARTIDALPKGATSEEKNKYAQSSEMIERAGRLVKEVEADSDAFGMRVGAASELSAKTGIPIQKALLTPEQIQLRSGVYQQAYETINKLAGAAFSATEAGRIMQFVPNPRDDSETIVAKLKSAMTEAHTQRSVLRQRYGMEQAGPRNAPGVTNFPAQGAPQTGPLKKSSLNARVNSYYD